MTSPYEAFLKKLSLDMRELAMAEMQRLMGQALNPPQLQARLRLFMAQFGPVFGAPGAMPGAGQAAYALLGLDPTAGDDAVRERYRLLMKRLHPDVAGPETAHLARMVVMAYQQISQERGWKT